jgi:Protein of unknown function (DUF4238)
MRPDGKAEVQHYVPQVLLRLHVNDGTAKRGSEQVWCFDKKTGKVFSPNIRGVLAGSRFYEVEVGGETISLEEPLSAIESQVAPILSRLVQNQKLSELTREDRFMIASFCAVQHLRTQAFRDRIKDLNEGVAEALRKRGIDPADVSNFKMLSEDEIKSLSMEMLADAPRKYGCHFVAKYWHLVGTTSDDPFHLGDHPVVLDNDVYGPARGALGLASPGVTIYLPLSPTLCLAMTDPVLVEESLEGARKVRAGYKEMQGKTPTRGTPEEWAAFLQEMKENHDRVNEQVRSFEDGAPSAYHPQIVMRVNSLQMLYGGRWIVSSKPDFSLPLKMIETDPGLRDRHKAEVE